MTIRRTFTICDKWRIIIMEYAIDFIWDNDANVWSTKAY